MLKLWELGGILKVCLAETEKWNKRWPTVSKVKMPDMPWFYLVERIQSYGDWNVRVDLPFKIHSLILGRSRRHTTDRYCEEINL